MTSAQHLNLIDEAMRPRRERASGADGVRALALACALMVVAWVGLDVATTRETRRFEQAQRQLMALQSHAPGAPRDPAGPTLANELAALQHHVATDAQVRTAIAGGAAGRAQGYSPYLLALARQARNAGPQALWITGFAISGDDDAIDLHGRMTDPRLLPDYLRRLDEEPLFRGRAFSQLVMRATPSPGTAGSPADGAPPPAGADGIVEFTLRANAQPVAGATALATGFAGGAR